MWKCVTCHKVFRTQGGAVAHQAVQLGKRHRITRI
jgi:hypothetical protein